MEDGHRLEWSPNRDQIVAALRRVRREIPPLRRNREAKVQMERGGEYKYKFTDLPELLAKLGPIVDKNDLLVTHGPIVVPIAGLEKPLFGVTTEINHEPSGQWVRATFLSPFVQGKMNAVQAVGSIITFGRRYNEAAILDLAMVDDDAAGLTGTPRSGKTEQAPTGSGQRQPTISEETRAVVAAINVLLNQRENGKLLFDPTEMKAWMTRANRDAAEGKPKLDATYAEVNALMKEKRERAKSPSGPLPPPAEPVAEPAEKPLGSLLDQRPGDEP